MINHRGPEFAAVMDDVIGGLRWALRTENDILLYPCSGTGGLEAAVVNLLSPGEQALFCVMGSFGERWAKIGDTYGADVVRLTVPLGEPIDPEDVERTLAEHPEITTVFVTHNETSTGVTNDLRRDCRCRQEPRQDARRRQRERRRLPAVGDRRARHRRAGHRLAEGLDGSSRRRDDRRRRGGVRSRRDRDQPALLPRLRAREEVPGQEARLPRRRRCR